jgi:bacterioferritin-associated ferredoxin
MIICNCHNINHKQLENFIIQNPGCKIKDVSKKTQAGTDCGICVKTVEEILLSLGNGDYKKHNRTKLSSNNYWEHT